MTENEQIRWLFNSLNMQQKYAYCTTIDLFLWYVKDDIVLQGLASLCNLNLAALNIAPEEAQSFFEKPGQLLGPLDYLKTIHDKAILDSLLFTCSLIVGQACGNVEGQDCHKLAEEHFYDWFSELGYSYNDINDTISKIMNFYPGNMSVF